MIEIDFDITTEQFLEHVNSRASRKLWFLVLARGGRFHCARQHVQETLASAASVADSCTTAALGLQQHSENGADGAGDSGIKRSLAAVADLLSGVKAGMHVLQALAAGAAALLRSC